MPSFSSERINIWFGVERTSLGFTIHQSIGIMLMITSNVYGYVRSEATRFGICRVYRLLNFDLVLSTTH